MPNASPQSESGKRPPHLRLTAVPMRRVGAYGQLPGRGHGRPFWNTSQKQAFAVQNPHTIPTSKTCRAECKAYDVPPSRGVSCTFLVPDKSHPPRQLEDFMLHCHSRTFDTVLARQHVLLRTAIRRWRACVWDSDCLSIFGTWRLDQVSEQTQARSPYERAAGVEEMTSRPEKCFQSWIQYV